MLKVSVLAPDFTLADQLGEKHRLRDYQGQWVLLYFYPKDQTSGCTKEACNFRDNLPHFEKLNLQVLGISADSVESHAKFASKYTLNFLILSDESKKVIKQYGATTGPFVKRISYLIDPNGIIYKVYPKVDPEIHAVQVKKDMQVIKWPV